MTPSSYVENPKESEQKVLNLNSIRFQGMRSIGKLMTCLYTNKNMETKFKIERQ